MMRYLRSLYCETDLRTLAVLRIGLGLLLLFDLAKRIPGAGIWYINSGLLPNHRVLWHPDPYQFSALFGLWTLSQVRVAFVVFAVVYGCFLVGYRTRLFHILSWLALLSLQTRATFLANGGDYVFGILLLWTTFMPLGARWSVDSLRSPARDNSSFTSLSVLALRLQLCVIYVFNAINKTGETWHEGSAVHYLLHQARIVTALGVWIREHVPPGFTQAATYTTLVVELAIPALILSPWFRTWCSRLAILLIWGLHTNIALLANLGVFSPVMMVFSLSLLRREDFEWLASRWPIFRVDVVRAEAAPEPSRIERARGRIRELTVGFLMLCAASQLIRENDARLGSLAHEQPTPIRATISYLRLNQGWSMFAPDAPRSDSWIVVDAVTKGGKHIDPFNRRASLVSDPKLRSIPKRLGQDVYFCDYTVRIVEDPEFHQPLEEWILNHWRRVHRPEEKFVRFDAYVLEHQSPPLGELEPTKATSRIFLHYEAAPDAAE